MALDLELKKRLRSDRAEELIMSAEDAAKFIEDGMVVGVSGFTPSGYPKAVPLALAERAKNGEKLQIELFSGASVGPEIDTALVETDVITKRLPYQTNSNLRNAVNAGKIKYVDMHLSQSPQYVNMGFLPKPDVVLVEALAITEEGNLILTTAVGNTPTFVKNSDKVIVELAMKKPLYSVLCLTRSLGYCRFYQKIKQKDS